MGVNNWPWITQQLQMWFGNETRQELRKQKLTEEVTSVRPMMHSRMRWRTICFFFIICLIIFSFLFFIGFSLRRNCSALDRIVRCRVFVFVFLLLFSCCNCRDKKDDTAACRHWSVIVRERIEIREIFRSGVQSPETTFSLFFLCQESSSTSSQVFFALDSLRWGNVLCVCVLSSRSATAVRTPAFSFRVSTTSHSSRSLLKFKDAHCHFF